MNPPIERELREFVHVNSFTGRGALCVALVITQRAKAGLPLQASALLASKKGQVAGLGRAQVQAVLARHGIERVLAQEGGRTSRGAIGNMEAYLAFLNALPRPVDLDAVERFWVERVKEFFAGKPFKLSVDASLSIRAAIRNLLTQAKDRQADVVGSRYEGTMLQHLVGAKLELVLGEGAFKHHSASEADQADTRSGDFCVGDVAIHVTTAPGDALMEKCRDNLGANLRPLIVTTSARVVVADGLAADAGIADRIDVLDIEQFLAANLHERALFSAAKRAPTTADLVRRYNAIIAAVETDPSLKIELSGEKPAAVRPKRRR